MVRDLRLDTWVWRPEAGGLRLEAWGQRPEVGGLRLVPLYEGLSLIAPMLEA